MADSHLGVNPASEEKLCPGSAKDPMTPTIKKQLWLLIERALLDERTDADRRTIVRFDAWTDPRILRTLMEHEDFLSPRARKLFCDGRPEMDPMVLRCAFEMFTKLPLDRARTLANGENYGVEVLVEGQAKLLLDTVQKQWLKEGGGRIPSIATSVDQSKSVDEPLPLLISKLADYLHIIFRLNPSPGSLPPRNLDILFSRFALGELRIEDQGLQEWMNAQPDSAYFFALAEFCIQAARFEARPGCRWWIALGGLFAALQDVFCVRYHRICGERRFSEYRDLYFNDKRNLSIDLVVKHVDLVRKRCDSVEKLVEQVTWNAFWYFFDDVLPPKDVPALEPSPPPSQRVASSPNNSAISRA